ncbi:uncharacterized protein LOC143289660 [Babylonia areolata]|uniref:uncharacterized protein LOC143289660 n=1 Tax=Babylonia areolata TaxID=304850 RepID=UPI003FD11659
MHVDVVAPEEVQWQKPSDVGLLIQLSPLVRVPYIGKSITAVQDKSNGKRARGYCDSASSRGVMHVIIVLCFAPLLYGSTAAFEGTSATLTEQHGGTAAASSPHTSTGTAWVTEDFTDFSATPTAAQSEEPMTNNSSPSLINMNVSSTSTVANLSQGTAASISPRNDESGDSMTDRSEPISTPAITKTQGSDDNSTPSYTSSGVSERVQNGAEGATSLSMTSNDSVTTGGTVWSNTGDAVTTARNSVTHTLSPASNNTPGKLFTQGHASQASGDISSNPQPPTANSSAGMPSVSSVTLGSDSTQNLASSTGDMNSEANTTQPETTQFATSDTGVPVSASSSSIKEASSQYEIGQTEESTSTTYVQHTSQDRDFTENYNPGNRNPSQDPSEASPVNTLSSTTAVSTSPESVQQHNFSSDHSGQPETSVGSDSPNTEGKGRGVTETTSTGDSTLSSGQTTALGFCLTMVTLTVVCAAAMMYRRRTQVGRWKLLDKSLRYRYWSYTSDCHQEDDIL